jgi:hypothetical protein
LSLPPKPPPTVVPSQGIAPFEMLGFARTKRMVVGCTLTRTQKVTAVKDEMLL